MNKTTSRRITSYAAVALAFFAASAMMSANAGTAEWKGGATGDITDPDNWNAGADIATDYLNFNRDVTVTQTTDVAVFNPFGNKQYASAYVYRNVVFDMCGHTLWATDVDRGAHKIQGNQGTSFTFTNGTLRAASKDDYSTTNVITTAGNAHSMSIVAVGSDTTLVGSFVLGAKTGLRILNGAKAYGESFNLLAVDAVNEVSNGSTLTFSTYFDVGTSSHSYTAYANAYNNTKVTVDNATLTSADPATKGTIAVNYGGKAYDNALIATNGATVAAKEIIVGAGGLNNNTLYTSSNGTFKVTGTGTTVNTSTDTEKGKVYCGYSMTTGNKLILDDGASLTTPWLYAGYEHSTNNAITVSGEGTALNARIVVGGADAAHKPYGNTFVLENGATSTGSMLYVNTVGACNTMTIRSGAKATVQNDVLLGGRSMLDGHKWANYYGESGRLEIVGFGSSLICGRNFMLRNGTDDPTKGQEFFVGDRANLTLPAMQVVGNGNRVVISNATVTLTGAFLPNGRQITSGTTIAYPATNTLVRLEGANAKFTMPRVQNLSGSYNQLAGAPILEFVIPEGGWTSAPFVVNQEFAISDDTRIRIDADSAMAFARAGGGTVPLISTDSASNLITADLSKISADLPAGVTLVNADGVLSAKIPHPGLILILR